MLAGQSPNSSMIPNSAADLETRQSDVKMWSGASLESELLLATCVPSTEAKELVTASPKRAYNLRN